MGLQGRSSSGAAFSHRTSKTRATSPQGKRGIVSSRVAKNPFRSVWRRHIRPAGGFQLRGKARSGRRLPVLLRLIQRTALLQVAASLVGHRSVLLPPKQSSLEVPGVLGALMHMFALSRLVYRCRGANVVKKLRSHASLPKAKLREKGSSSRFRKPNEHEGPFFAKPIYVSETLV